MHKFDRHVHIRHLDAVLADTIRDIITGFRYIYFRHIFFYCDEIYTIFIRAYCTNHMRRARLHINMYHT